ncbi:hypothetical protein VTO73DRAFT_9899 [Trametes versicolor]
MPPSRKPIIHNPSHNAPVSYLPYKLRSSSRKSGVGHIRAGDLAAQALPPRPPIENVALNLGIEELQGEVEGCFQDPSTWTLVLILKPDMFMTPIKLTLAEFVGDMGQHDTSTWLVRLVDRPGRFAKRVRSYKWLERYSFDLLTTPYLTLPMGESWGKLLAYVWHIKRRFASHAAVRAIHHAHRPVRGGGVPVTSCAPHTPSPLHIFRLEPYANINPASGPPDTWYYSASLYQPRPIAAEDLCWQHPTGHRATAKAPGAFPPSVGTRWEPLHGVASSWADQSSLEDSVVMVLVRARSPHLELSAVEAAALYPLRSTSAFATHPRVFLS